MTQLSGTLVYVVTGSKVHIAIRRTGGQLLTDERCNLDDATERREQADAPDDGEACEYCFGLDAKEVQP